MEVNRITNIKKALHINVDATKKELGAGKIIYKRNFTSEEDEVIEGVRKDSRILYTGSCEYKKPVISSNTMNIGNNFILNSISNNLPKKPLYEKRGPNIPEVNYLYSDTSYLKVSLIKKDEGMIEKDIFYNLKKGYTPTFD